MTALIDTLRSNGWDQIHSSFWCIAKCSQCSSMQVECPIKGRLFNSAPASRKGRRSVDREGQKVAAFLPPSHNHHECWLHALSADGCWRAKRYADAAANISSRRILARPCPSPQDLRHAVHGGTIWPTFGRLTLTIWRNELLFLLHFITTHRIGVLLVFAVAESLERMQWIWTRQSCMLRRCIAYKGMLDPLMFPAAVQMFFFLFL